VVKGSRKKNTRLTNNIRPQVVVPKKKHKYKTLSSHCFFKKADPNFFSQRDKKCALVSKKGLSSKLVKFVATVLQIYVCNIAAKSSTNEIPDHILVFLELGNYKRVFSSRGFS